MNFLQKIKSSIYDPAFYRMISKESFGSAFKYYFLLSFLLTIFMTLFLVFPITRGITTFTQQFSKDIINSYPNELQIALKNGHVVTNVSQPYSIPVCDENRQCENIIIDTRNTINEGYLQQSNLLALI